MLNLCRRRRRRAHLCRRMHCLPVVAAAAAAAELVDNLVIYLMGNLVARVACGSRPTRPAVCASKDSVLHRLVSPCYRTLCGPVLAAAYPRDLSGNFISRKLPKLDLTTDAEYAASLVNVNMWLYKRATVQFIIWVSGRHFLARPGDISVRTCK